MSEENLNKVEDEVLNAPAEDQTDTTANHEDQGNASEEQEHKGDEEQSPEDAQAKLLEKVLGESDAKDDDGKKEDEDGDESNKEEKPPENVENKEQEQKNEQKSDDRTDEQIAESLKSERGKARFHELLNEKATLEQEKKGYEEIVSGIRDTFEAAKLTPEDFAANIEFSRLRNSDNPNDVRLAYEMLEQERANLAMKLGIKAPGVDYLKDYPDIAKAVEDMRIDEDAAIELARQRKYIQDVEASKQIQQQSYVKQTEYQKAIESAEAQINSFFISKINEIDHAAKEKHVRSIFSDPAKVQELAAKYEPHQWPSVIKMIYDSMPAGKSAAQVQRQQPISSRTSSLGKPTVSGKTEEERMLSILDGMGL